MENLLGGVGSGLTFKPSDAVAVSYLFNKQMGHPLRFDGWVIKVADLYGDQEPWELPGVYEKVGFFYTKLKKTTPNGRRYSRTVGKSGGTWMGYDKGQPIYDKKGRPDCVIGIKKSFIYENKINSEKSGVWSMKEYSVDGELLNQIKSKKSATNIQDDDDDDDDDTEVLVLCQINKNTSTHQEQNASLLTYYVAAAHHHCPQITTTTTTSTPLDQEAMENDLFRVESGVTFSPSDAVAVCYLFNKQVGQPMRYDRWVIKDVDLYGDQEPWELLGGVDEEVGFFYTNLKKKTPNAKHYCRTVGKSGGTWTRIDQGQCIYDQKEGRVIGLKKGLVYQNKNNSSRSGCRWLMKEYSVDGELLKILKQIKRNRSGSVRDDDDDVVLCQIKKKVIKGNKTNN